MQVMPRSRFITAGFKFIYLHFLASSERPKPWSLGTSEMEVAIMQQLGEAKGSQGGLLESRTGGHAGVEKR